jgi:hypothetical protein
MASARVSSANDNVKMTGGEGKEMGGRGARLHVPRTSAGFLNGRNSPRVTASGTEKAILAFIELIQNSSTFGLVIDVGESVNCLVDPPELGHSSQSRS